MDFEPIEYHPYRSSKGFIIFILAVIVFALIISCVVSLANNHDISLFLLAIMSILVVSIKNIYFAIKIKICLDLSGVYICEKGNISHMERDSIKYCYLTKDYKGYQYLVLSRFPMSNEETKRAANQSAVKTQVYFGEWCSIYLDPHQSTATNKIRQYITLIGICGT